MASGWQLGEEIAGGQAWQKHLVDKNEFPEIATQAEFASLIENGVLNGQMTTGRLGRTDLPRVSRTPNIGLRGPGIGVRDGQEGCVSA